MARSTTKKESLSGYMRFFMPILATLSELGGAARSAQVKDMVTDRLKISEAERAEVLKNGVSRVGNQIDWARFYLAKTGYLDSSKRGVWALTETPPPSSVSLKGERTISIDRCDEAGRTCL